MDISKITNKTIGTPKLTKKIEYLNIDFLKSKADLSQFKPVSKEITELPENSLGRDLVHFNKNK